MSLRGAASLSTPSPLRVFALPPLVQTHRVITHVRHLLEQPVVLAFEKVIEPRVRQLVVVQTRIADTALADDRVFSRAFVTTVQYWRDDGILLIRNLRRRRLANVIERGEVWTN